MFGPTPAQLREQMTASGSPSSSTASSATQPQGRSKFLEYQSSMERLEGFLEEVLKKDLDTVMRKRDEVYQQIADCGQLRQLLVQIKEQSKPLAEPSSKGAPSAVTRPKAASHTVSAGALGGISHASDSTASAVWTPTEEVQMLTDLGCHFYAPCTLSDPTTVNVNVGCGVFVAMDHEEASRFLVKKENMLKEKAFTLTKEAVRLRYRIRVVLEALARLYEAQNALGKKAPR
jgi:prefoldin subunit 5